MKKNLTGNSFWLKVRKNKPVIWISIVCLLSQAMLLLCTGIWREDWLIQTMCLKELIVQCRESALGINAFIFYPLLQLSDYGLRIVIFLTFLTGTIFLYGFLMKTDFFTRKICFWIVLLYTVAPTNDSKIMMICYPYTVSLCLFWVAAYLAAVQEKGKGKKKVICRAFSLASLFISLFTESLLVFSAVIFAYFFFYNYKEKGMQAFFLRMRTTIKEHIDYVLLPFAFFYVKHTFFKPYGTMLHYNSPSWQTFLHGIWLLPATSVKAFCGLVKNNADQVNVLSIVAIIVAATLLVFRKRYKRNTIEREERTGEAGLRQDMWILAAGILCFILGVFPYLVIRQEKYDINWLGGKDAILLGLGFAMILVSLACMLVRRRETRILLALIPVILGIFHSNKMYLYYQDDWYHQLQLMDEIKTNISILEHDTFLVIYSDGSYHDTTRYYTMNGGAKRVTEEASRFFMSDPSMIGWLDNMPEWAYMKRNWMSDYDPDEKKLDGVILINDKYMGTGKLLWMKFWEIFNKDRFRYEISKTKDIRFMELTDGQYERIYHKFLEGNLTEDFIKNVCLENL